MVTLLFGVDECFEGRLPALRTPCATDGISEMAPRFRAPGLLEQLLGHPDPLISFLVFQAVLESFVRISTSH